MFQFVLEIMPARGRGRRKRGATSTTQCANDEQMCEKDACLTAHPSWMPCVYSLSGE